MPNLFRLTSWSSAALTPARRRSLTTTMCAQLAVSLAPDATICARMAESPSAWWCRVDSNHRQRDYESRALPPELRHRRFESLAGGLDSRLQLALLLPVLVDGDALSLVHSFRHATNGGAEGRSGGGWRVWTDDLW